MPNTDRYRTISRPTRAPAYRHAHCWRLEYCTQPTSRRSFNIKGARPRATSIADRTATRPDTAFVNTSPCHSIATVVPCCRCRNASTLGSQRHPEAVQPTSLRTSHSPGPLVTVSLPVRAKSRFGVHMPTHHLQSTLRHRIRTDLSPPIALAPYFLGPLLTCSRLSVFLDPAEPLLFSGTLPTCPSATLQGPPIPVHPAIESRARL